MLGFRFSYLYKLHTESFMGFNAVCLPGNPPGAFYRSSLPATPVSTPIRENGRFSEQALRERLCRTPSPRKCRLFESRVSEPDIGFNVLNSGLQLSSPDDEIDEEAPLAFSPARPSRLERLEQERDTPANKLKRRLFVGNLPGYVTKKELKDFFSKFGKVADCLIVQDHIKRRSRGYGFVIFSNYQDAEKARNAPLSDLEFSGKVLRVFPAQERKSEEYKREARQILFQQNLEAEHFKEEEPAEYLGPRISRSGSLQNINEMNDDMLLLIFSYLGIRDRVRLEFVCKKWRKLALDLWRTRSSMDLQNVFCLWEGKPLTNSILLSLLKKCAGNLRRLDLSTASHTLDYKAVEIIAQCCPNLEHINLSSVKVTNVSLQQLAIKCPKLRQVLLERCFEVGEKGIWWLLHLCKKLELIDLTGNARITGQCFHMAGSNLQTCVLRKCSREIVCFSRNFLLNFINANSMSENTLLSLQTALLAALISHVSGCDPTSALYKRLNYDHVILQHRQLCFSPMGFTKLATRCRQMSALYLDDCFQLSDRALELLCQSLRNLKVLYVGGVFPDLTPSGLHHIGRLANLEQLGLSHNQNVDDDVVYAISRGCRKLRHLELSGCNDISDYSLTSLSSCYSLRTLHISYLDRITDEGLSSLSRQGNFETIQLRGCPNIGDQGLLTLVLLCPYLQLLDISGCQHITNVTVTACLDSVQARSSGKKMLLIVGGTSVELEALELDSSLLEISRRNYCINSLRPHSLDYLNVDSDDDDDDDDEPTFGKEQVEATPSSVDEENVASGEAIAAFVPCDMNGDWSEIYESPL